MSDISFEIVSEFTLNNSSNINGSNNNAVSGKKLGTTLYANSKMKKLDNRWKVFVGNNNLKSWNALFKELFESSNEKVKVKVPIMRSGFAAELALKLGGNGSTRNIHILVD